MEIYEPTKCPTCDSCFYSLNGMSVHFRRKHKSTSKDLYILLYCSGIEPTCKCGCGSKVTFLDISRGFRDYVRGHASRVNNNFVSKKAQENSAKTRRKMIKDGTWKPFALKETGEAWNLGLTKETDQRIANMAESISGNAEEIAKRSQRMKKGRLDGTIPSITGQKHPNWKGGYSPLLNICHSNTRLYNEWKLPILERSGFSCSECGNNFYRNSRKQPGLQVHHDKASMATIVRLIAEQNSWEDYHGKPTKTDEKTLALKKKISDEVTEYHINNNVSGVVLCKQCHKKEHDKLNF